MGATGEANYPSTAVMELLDRVHARLIGFARGLLGEEEDARDVVQDVVVDAWHATRRQTPPFAHPLDEAAIRRWLFHAAYWKAVSARRRPGAVAWESLDAAQESGRFDTGIASVRGVPSGGFEQRIAEAEVLLVALRSLEDEEAACLLLHVVQGYTSVEIGHTLQITSDAVRKRLSRAMGRLRAAYFAQGVEGQSDLGLGRPSARSVMARKEVDR
jgi:RNA polymerase sigma factor (sigma-70 family)